MRCLRVVGGSSAHLLTRKAERDEDSCQLGACGRREEASQGEAGFFRGKDALKELQT